MPNGGDVVLEYWKQGYIGAGYGKTLPSVIGDFLRANENLRFVGTTASEDNDVLLLIFDRAQEIIGQPLKIPKELELIIYSCSEKMVTADGSVMYAST